MRAQVASDLDFRQDSQAILSVGPTFQHSIGYTVTKRTLPNLYFLLAYFKLNLTSLHNPDLLSMNLNDAEYANPLYYMVSELLSINFKSCFLKQIRCQTHVSQLLYFFASLPHLLSTFPALQKHLKIEK